MNTLSGNKETDMLILQQLSDYDLSKVCQVNKYVNSLCNADRFWMNRILNIKGNVAGKKEDENYKEFYDRTIGLNIRMCWGLRQINPVIILPIFQLYLPTIGIFPEYLFRASVRTEYLLQKILLKFYRKDEHPHNHIARVINMINHILTTIPAYELETVSWGTNNFTARDKDTFLKIINISITRSFLIRHIAGMEPQTIRPLMKIAPAHEYAKFIIYLHDLFRGGKIPLDITWEDLCSKYAIHYE